MITLDQYFGSKEHSPLQADNAGILLDKVNKLIAETDLPFPVNPKRGDQISGNKDGDGGFRLPDSKTGVAGSKHKQGHAVDIYDPLNELDKYLDDRILTLYGLYREHPDSTPTWTHLQSIPPGSGKRTFFP